LIFFFYIEALTDAITDHDTGDKSFVIDPKPTTISHRLVWENVLRSNPG